MDWGKVVYIFFSLMSLTTTAGFLYDHNAVALFIAAGVNVLSRQYLRSVSGIFLQQNCLQVRW